MIATWWLATALTEHTALSRVDLHMHPSSSSLHVALLLSLHLHSSSSCLHALEDDVMYSNDYFLLRLCGTQHRWLAGLEAYMPLALIHETFAFGGSRLWAQTELEARLPFV
ncbi:unnamed protein product [Pleuronectes platessa]|uniref:Uncharacterized protein n=1 Tax=Pleuronectes platessa TaxID=8262 RepID=A0A9N7TXZ4_PLEPL|nr:unnamed protein product [Pleuronectes platessa]